MGKITDLLRIKLWQDPNYELHQMNCPEITIAGIDQELYAKLLAGASSAGAKFDGVKASIKGCDFDWNYDTEAQILHIICTRRPIYADCERVESEIKKIVEAAKGTI